MSELLIQNQFRMEHILFHEKIISGMCRLCLSSNSALIDMFSFSSELGSQIANAITKCTSVHVVKHRELPSTICELCYIQLIRTQNFQLQALKSDRTFQIYLQRLHDDKKLSLLESAVIPPDTHGDSCIETNSTKQDKEDNNTNCEEVKPEVKYSVGGSDKPEMDIVENKVSASGSKSHTEWDDHSCNKDSVFNPNLIVKAEPIINDNEDQFAFDTEILNDFSANQRNIKLDNEVSSDKIMKCDACNKCFTVSNELKKHKCISEKPLQCDVCNKCFSTSADFTTHQRIHTGEKPYQCDVCNKCFSESGTLEIHKRIHTCEKPYYCDVCNKNFKEFVYLKTHQRLHTGELPYKCDVCDKSFNVLRTLRRHQRVHTDERPYPCDVCNKSFRDVGHLKRHQRSHTGEKPYQCERCNKRFTVSSHLHDHIRTHTGEKPYQCNVCYKSFSKLNNLRTHQRIHTGEKPYQCDICKNCFSQLSGLNSHKRKHASDVLF